MLDFSWIMNPFSRQFRHLATLNGHSGPIMSIAFSANGKYIASGGADGVKIWDAKTRKPIDVPKQAYNERAQVACVCWITRRNEAVDTLCYGNALGFLIFLQYSPAEARFEAVNKCRVARGGEVMYVTTDTSTSEIARVAACTRDKCVQVWTFNGGNCKLFPVYSKAYLEERDVVPKALAIDNNADRDLFVFGLYDGGLHKYSGKDAISISRYQLGTQIGNVAVDLERRLCVVDNVGDGFDIYKLDSGSFVTSLSTKDPLKTYPKGVVFAARSYAVIGGSDHGRVYIFERKTGKIINTLTHARKGGVETIAAIDRSDGSVLIATASSTATVPSPIYLWKWTPVQKANEYRWTISSVVLIVFKTIICVAACAYFFEIMKRQYMTRMHTTVWRRLTWYPKRGWKGLEWHPRTAWRGLRWYPTTAWRRLRWYRSARGVRFY